MRNKIYAIHGYMFNDSDLKYYFENKSWYRPTTSNSIDLYNNRFSQVERYNVDFIKKAENVISNLQIKEINREFVNSSEDTCKKRYKKKNKGCCLDLKGKEHCWSLLLD